jgi:hypothetical protein
MHTFSEKALAVLHEAGWSEDRQIDITPYVEMLEKEGNVVFLVVADFLRRFGGLDLSWQHPLPGVREEIWHHLYILSPYSPGLIRIQPKSSLEGSEAVLGVNLCSIGNTSMDILMTEAGRVYGNDGADFYDLGNSGEEMIEKHVHWHPIHNLFQVIEVDWGDET